MSKAVQQVTEIPGPKSKALLKERDRYVPAGVHNTVPVFAERAKGAVIWDVDGNSYLDFAGGIGVINVGHCPDEVVAAIREQAGKFIHTCFHSVMYEPYVALARKLAEITPGDCLKKVVLVNSGAEAVENAIKIARKCTKRPTVITLENAFHGRTLLTMTLTSKVMPYRMGFGPMAPEVVRIPSAYCYRCVFDLTYPQCDLRCADNLERVIKLDVGPDNAAAFIAEPVQGEGGFIVPPKGYFERIQGICRRYGMLFICDEIQTGFGRTGRMFAIEHSAVVPDLLLVAKSLGAGIPISGVIGRAEVMDSIHVGGVGGTFAGNPLGCVAALEVIKLLQNGLVEHGATIGRRLLQRSLELKDRFPIIGEVRALGPMVALELVKDRRSREPAAAETVQVIEESYRRGLIMVKAGVFNNVIRFLAPLVITEEQVDEGLGMLAEALSLAQGQAPAGPRPETDPVGESSREV